MHVDQEWVKLLDKILIGGHKETAKQDSIREIIGAHVVLDGSAEQFLQNPRRKLSPIYASAELLWYLRREKSAEMIMEYAPSYTEFCDDGIHAHGAYGDRLANNLATTTDGLVEEDLLTTVIALLKQRSTTKKAVVLLWRPDDLLRAYDNDHAKESRDVPCTISWQFLARGEQLHMVCSMRSCDMWKGFLFDSYVNTVIQRYVAAALGLTAGDYHHIAGSMHLYERDVKKAQEALEAAYSYTEYQEPYHPSNNYWNESQLAYAIQSERAFRVTDKAIVNPKSCSVLYDAVLCCAAKWHPGLLESHEIRSPGLRRAMDGLSQSKV